MTFNNRATYTTIRLSQIMRDIADILERSNCEEIVELYAGSSQTTSQLTVMCKERLYRRAQYGLGLCKALSTTLLPWGSRKDRAACVDIVRDAIRALYPPPSGTCFNAFDPFKAYGASYCVSIVDWKFRAEAARRIADWIEKNHTDYTLTTTKENDDEQL